MRFLKKVSVTSNDTSGKIIDSFNTGDNHTVNAPSLNAVEERVQGCFNNLLLAGDFITWFATKTALGNTYDLPLGWSAENCYINPTQGIFFMPNSNASLTSTMYIAPWDLTVDEGIYPLALSVQFTVNGTDKEKSITLYRPTTAANYVIDEIIEGVNLRVATTTTAQEGSAGIALRFYTSDVIPSGNSFSIKRVKLEKGATPTPILIPDPRDAALYIALKSIFAQIGEVAGLKVFEFSGTLPTSLNVQEDLTADSGYNLSILAAYAYNRTDSKYYQMSMSSVVGAEYYRPQIYTFGNKARITLDSTSLNNYSGQSYKVFALGWKES